MATEGRSKEIPHPPTFEGAPGPSAEISHRPRREDVAHGPVAARVKDLRGETHNGAVARLVLDGKDPQPPKDWSERDPVHQPPEPARGALRQKSGLEHGLTPCRVDRQAEGPRKIHETRQHHTLEVLLVVRHGEGRGASARDVSDHPESVDETHIGEKDEGEGDHDGSLGKARSPPPDSCHHE